MTADTRQNSDMQVSASTTASPWYKSLFLQVLAALLLGIIIGTASPTLAVQLKVLSDAFLRLISMIVAPIVFYMSSTASPVRAISRRSAGSASNRSPISK
jgi:Na+/H+-dicarboxylate symporter